MSKKKGIFVRIQKHIHAHTKKDIFILISSLFLVSVSIGMLWISSFRLPDLSSFGQRKIPESTKIFDRTGTVLLYDLNEGVKRTLVSSDEISPFLKKATVAIEDEDFYTHRGIKISSIIRAVFANIISGGYSQGGSTITQQVVKNTLLTGDKTISRKLKEWVLAIKLDNTLSKDVILTSYLNENPYGGNIYGVEEASKQFFNKKAKDVTLAEAAYLAAIPQASTYYSPYGKNRAKLEERKNLVLKKMLDIKSIKEDEYTLALKENITFQPQNRFGIKAPHFVFFVKDYLERIIGKESFNEGGYKVITTLDANLQEKAEDLVKTTALKNTNDFNATNAALIALDPHTGDILSMVGSRDYFDKEIDGQFNVAIESNRQPGSTMKPIIYAEAFVKGLTPETVVFDLKTSFSTACDLEGKPLDPLGDPKQCYVPGNYDEKFRGPISLRDALAQSINIPAIKTLYLAGIKDSVTLAKNMGITSLTNADQYGLTLVLGGGEVSLLEMTGVYGVFANDGKKITNRPVLQMFDSKGVEIALPPQKQNQVLPEEVARTISSILSDNKARTPAYGPNSVLYIPTRDVAVKTGTTNDSRDAWTIGYTPNLVVGVWAGNNDNSPMVKKVAGQIVAPLWNSFMKEALTSIPDERFVPPNPPDQNILKPVMRGIWQGGKTYTIDTISQKLATNLTPKETQKEIPVINVHSILYWIDKTNILGPQPIDPSNDPQFERWEAPVRLWAQENGYVDQNDFVIPTQIDDIHTAENNFKIYTEDLNVLRKHNLNETITITLHSTGKYKLSKASLYINNVFIENTESDPFVFRFEPKYISNIQEFNQIKIIGYDSVFNKDEVVGGFSVLLDR